MIEELGVHQVDRAVDRRNFIRTLVFINRQQRFVARLDLIGSQRVADFFIVAEERSIQQHIQVQEFARFTLDDVLLEHFQT